MTLEQAKKCDKKKIEMIYLSASGVFTKRKIKVLGISDKAIYGYCYLRKQKRTFLFDHILAVYPLFKEEDE